MAQRLGCRASRKGANDQRRASSSTICEPFSAIMTVGELVFPEVIRGIAEADESLALADCLTLLRKHVADHPAGGEGDLCRADRL